MNRLCEKLLPRAAFTLNKDGGITLGYLFQHSEKAQHFFVFTDYIMKGMTSGKLLAQGLHQAQVTECFNTSNYIAFPVFEQGR